MTRDDHGRLASERIVEVLGKAKAPLTIDEICQRVYGRIGDRERSTVRQNLSRLDARGRLIRHVVATTYELRR